MSQSHSKLLLKHTLIYGTSDVLNRAFAFLLLPIYTRYLSVEHFGILQILIIITNLLEILLPLGLGSAIFKSVLHKKNPDNPLIYSTALFFISIFTTLVFLILILSSEMLSQIIFQSKNYSHFLNIVFLKAFFLSFTIIPLARFRIENKSKIFGLFVCIRFFMQLVMNIFFVVILKKGVWGILISECIVTGIFMFVCIVSIIPKLKIRISFTELKDMLEFGLPLVPAGVAMFVLTMSDRFFLKHYLNLEIVAIYSVGYRLASVIGLVVRAFQRAWPSVMFTIAKDKDAKKIFALNFNYFLFIFFNIVLILNLFSSYLLRLAAPAEYADAVNIIPLLSFAFLCYGVYYYTSAGMNIKKKTIYQPFIIGGAALLSITFNIFLIPRIGITGASISYFVAFLFIAFMAMVVSNLFYRIPYDYKKTAFITILFIILNAISLVYNPVFPVYHILYKIILLLLFNFILFKFHYFDINQVKRLKTELIRYFKNRG